MHSSLKLLFIYLMTFKFDVDIWRIQCSGFFFVRFSSESDVLAKYYCVNWENKRLIKVLLCNPSVFFLANVTFHSLHIKRERKIKYSESVPSIDIPHRESMESFFFKRVFEFMSLLVVTVKIQTVITQHRFGHCIMFRRILALEVRY